MDDQTDDRNQPVPSAEEDREAAADEELGRGPGSSQDPTSPHAVAPQSQDEEAEKAEAAETAAGAHPVPPAEEELHTDLELTADAEGDEGSMIASDESTPTE